MNLGLLKIGLTTALTLGVSQASADSEAYVEMKQDEILRELSVNPHGPTPPKQLTPVVTAIAGSILALDIIKLQKTLELQKLNPADVNFTSTHSKGETQVSTGGVFCGIRIVDIPNEDIRETDVMEKSNLCLPLKSLMENTIAMDGNLPAIQAAVQDVQFSNNNIRLAELAVGLQEKNARDLLNQSIDVELVAKGSGFVKPVSGRLVVTDVFGMRKHPVLGIRRMHKGTDFQAASGSVVKAALPGRVLALKSERAGKRGELKGYGYYVIVVHPDQKMETLYAHLSGYKSKPGQEVAAGERIAASGATGIGTGPHLHFETHVGTRAVNPMKYIGHLVGKLEVWFEKYFKLT